MNRLSAEIRTLDDATEVYSGHNYGKANGAFALSIEPENPALKARIPEMEQRLRGALLPKDAADARPAILEIRPGTGGEDRDFKWNNYLSRYHERHTDLMDVLAGYQPRASARLDEVAPLLGFPGKMGMSGAKVWDAFLGGDIEGIRNYCETDVLNTYLVYLRFELIRGHLTPQAYDKELKLLRDTLVQEDKAHLREFVVNWTGG